MTAPVTPDTVTGMTPPVEPPAAPPVARSLANVTADGAVWMVVMTLLTRVMSVVGQLALTRLLMPKELGVVSLAQFVASCSTFLGTLGLMQFLITRQHKLKLYVNTAFWLSLVLGAGNSLFIAISAPIAAYVYHEPQLYGLLLFNVVTAPIGAIAVVPTTLAGISLRFKLSAMIMVLCMFAQIGVSVAAAAMGFGPYSIFFGTTAAAIVKLVVSWKALRLKFHFKPRRSYRAERLLLGATSWWIVGTGVAAVFLSQGDYATMGFFFTPTELGYYYFAFNLAQQAVVLFGTSLGNVLYPAIASIGADRDRQAAAVLRAVRLLTLFGAPGGLLLMFCIPPLVHVFGRQYLPAIPIAQVMSAGAIALLAAGPSTALINAQGRFKFYFLHTLLMTGIFLVLVLIGCLTRSVVGVATAVAVFFWIGGPLGMTLAIDGFRITADTLRKSIRAIGEPAMWCLPATAVAMAVFLAVHPASLLSEVLRSTLVSGLFLLIALPTLWLAMPGPSREAMAIGRGVLGRLPVVKLWIKS